jgi:AcrR family transcriptional regulator
VNENETLLAKLISTAGEMYMSLGIKSVSMDEIAQKMGVSKKTVYTLVGNKEELITLVLEADACEDLHVMEANHRSAKDAIDEFLLNSRYFIRQMRKISPATMRDLQKYYPGIFLEKMKAHHDEFQNSIMSNLDRGMEEGLYRDDLDSELVANFYVGMMLMVIDTKLFPAQDRLLADIIKELSVYHFHGITNQFGRDRVELYLKQEALE